MKIPGMSQFWQSKKAIALAAFALIFLLILADNFIVSYCFSRLSPFVQGALTVLITSLIAAMLAWYAAGRVIAFHQTIENLVSCEIQNESHHAMMKAYYHYLINTLKTLVSMIEAYTSKGKVDDQLIDSAKTLALEIKNDLKALSELENPTKADIFGFLRNHHF